MKRINLLGIFLSIILSSCSSYEIHDGNFKFEDKYYNQETNIVYDEDYSLIQKALDNKESFGIYVFVTGCSICEGFKPYLDEFLKEYKLQIYSVNYVVMKYSEDKYHDLIKYAPSVMLFNKGNLEGYLDANKDEDEYAYKSKRGLASWFSYYVKIKEEN